MDFKNQKSTKSFIPMNELLKRGHRDRVKDYLSQMTSDEPSADDVRKILASKNPNMKKADQRIKDISA